LQRICWNPVLVCWLYEKSRRRSHPTVLRSGCLKTDVKNEDAENRAYRKYLYHGISHHLGIDVHDLGQGQNQSSPEWCLL
jgi:hypothetical protein